MPVAGRLWSLERAAQAAIAATILSAALASGSIQSWIPTARTLRWAALAALGAVAVAWAWRSGGVRVPRAALGSAAAFLALAGVSAVWSVEPKTTVARAAALGLVLVAAAALASVAVARIDAAERVLDGVVVGAALVAAGGLLVLLFRHDRAIQPATTTMPARYQGLGGGPNAATMLMAVALPAAAHVALEPGRAVRRAFGWAVALGLLASIVASGSRGALVGGFAGLLVFAALREWTLRRAAVAAAAVLALLAVAVALAQLPDPGGPGAPVTRVPPDPDPAPARAVPPYVDANLVLRLQDDVGRPPPGVQHEDEGRPLIGSSGRTEAWAGALRQAVGRPLLGYGFGTEPVVFVDRYVGFNSGVPENSYVGLALQIGLAGLLAFALLAGALLAQTVRGAREGGRRRRLAAACAGAFSGGLVLALFQSYVYAAGNNATSALWICGFLLVAAAAPADGVERR